MFLTLKPLALVVTTISELDAAITVAQAVKEIPSIHIAVGVLLLAWTMSLVLSHRTSE